MSFMNRRRGLAKVVFTACFTRVAYLTVRGFAVVLHVNPLDDVCLSENERVPVKEDTWSQLPPVPYLFIERAITGFEEGSVCPQLPRPGVKKVP